jgi:hypothetical protein
VQLVLEVVHQVRRQAEVGRVLQAVVHCSPCMHEQSNRPA